MTTINDRLFQIEQEAERLTAKAPLSTSELAQLWNLLEEHARLMRLATRNGFDAPLFSVVN